MSKRILAFILAFVMTVLMLSVSAFAEETLLDKSILNEVAEVASEDEATTHERLVEEAKLAEDGYTDPVEALNSTENLTGLTVGTAPALDSAALPDYFYITNTGTETATLKWITSGTPTLPTLQYSTNSNDFSDLTVGSTTITLAPNASVYFRGDYSGASFSNNNYIYLNCAESNVALKVGGDLTTLLDGKGDVSDLTAFTQYTFTYLFKNLTALTDASELRLPSDQLQKYCYCSMFRGCTNLTATPALPATTLAEYCYWYMFYGCTNLTAAPVLPATTLADYCYGYMFYKCTGLTTAPVLPATTLAKHCYNNMFCTCTGLKTAPALPATTLADYCYSNMFYKCEGLTTAPALPATTLANSCYYNMFRTCTGLTTAPVLPATTLVKSCYGGMFYGCTELTTAPALPATTLADGCYSSMFSDCKALERIPYAASTIGGQSNWVYGVANNGIFISPIKSNNYSQSALPKDVLNKWMLTTPITVTAPAGCTLLYRPLSKTEKENAQHTVLGTNGAYIFGASETVYLVAPEGAIGVTYKCGENESVAAELGEDGSYAFTPKADCTIEVEFALPHTGTHHDVAAATGIASVLSEGNLWIVIAVAVLAIGGVAALVIVKKKKPTAVGGGNNSEEQ